MASINATSTSIVFFYSYVFLAFTRTHIPFFFFFRDANTDEKNKIDTLEKHSGDLSARHSEKKRV
jgi:hypothetical protein